MSLQKFKVGEWEVFHWPYPRDDVEVPCTLEQSSKPVYKWACLPKRKLDARKVKELVVDCKEKRAHVIPTNRIMVHENIASKAGIHDAELYDQSGRFIRLRYLDVGGFPHMAFYYVNRPLEGRDIADKCLCSLGRSGVLGMDLPVPEWTGGAVMHLSRIKERCARSRG